MQNQMQISTAIGVSAWNHCVFECFAFLFGASDILTHTISYPYASFAPGCEKWIGIVAISQTLNMVSFSLRAEWQEPVFTNCTHACFDRHYISTDLGTFFCGKIVFHRISKKWILNEFLGFVDATFSDVRSLHCQVHGNGGDFLQC